MVKNIKKYCFLMAMKDDIYFTLILGLLLLSGNMLFFSLNKSFMVNEFEKYNIYSDVPNAETILDEIHDYFDGKKILEIVEFNEREITHIKDVKVAMNIIKAIFFLSLIGIGLLFYFRGENIIDTILKSSFSLIVFFLVFGLFLSKYFMPFFIWVHDLFFAPGSYIFDPNTEIITRIFPESIFFDIGLYTILGILVELVLIILAVLIIKNNWEKVFEKFKFFRPIHVIFSIVGFLCGYWIVKEGIIVSLDTISGAVSVGLIVSAGFIFNDIMDLNVDRANKKKRAIVTNIVSLIWAKQLTVILIILSSIFALLTNANFFLTMIFMCIIALGYSIGKKNVVSTLTAALMISSVFLLGGIAAEIITYKLVLFFFITAIYLFCREIVKDIDDIKGDKKFGYKTIPILIGVKRSQYLIRSISVLLMLFGIVMYRFDILLLIFYEIANVLLLYSTYSEQKKAKHVIYLGLLLYFIAAFSSLWV